MVVGHTKGCPSVLLGVIYTFHMPLFFFISGYLLNFSKWKLRAEDFIKNRFERLVIPYFIMSCLFFYPLWYVLGRNFGYAKELAISANKAFAGIFYGCSIDGWLIINGPMWFLLCLFISEILVFIVLNASERRQCQIMISGFMAILGYAISRYYLLPWSFDVAMVVQVFLLVGYYMKGSKYTERGLIVFVVFFLLAYLFNGDGIGANSRNYNNLFVYYIGGISGTLVATWLSIRIAKISLLNSFLCNIGKESLSVLLFHSLGFKVSSAILIFAFHLQLDYIHAHLWYLQVAISIVFCLFVIKVKNYFFNWSKSNGYFRLARLFTW